MFAFNTVLLYDYYTWYNMCSAWFLDIRISTCLYSTLDILWQISAVLSLILPLKVQ